MGRTVYYSVSCLPFLERRKTKTPNRVSCNLRVTPDNEADTAVCKGTTARGGRNFRFGYRNLEKIYGVYTVVRTDLRPSGDDDKFTVTRWLVGGGKWLKNKQK